MSDKYLVYMYTNNINGKKYIGVTTNVKKRAGGRGGYYRGSPRFYNAIQKYGWENFEVSIIKDGLSKKEASTIEKDLISKFKTIDKNYGYNLQRGGFPENFKSYSDDRNKRISDTLKQQRSSEEYRHIMASRMREVWRNKRDYLLQCRKNTTPGGRGKIRVFCKTLNKTYASLKEASLDLGVSPSGIAAAFKNGRRHIVKNRYSKNPVIYEIEKI